MLTSRWFFLVLLVLAGPPSIAQCDYTVSIPVPGEDNERFIDRLKETLVSQIEPKLPDESFDSWFSRLVKPERVEYEVCETREGLGSGQLWVIAYTQPWQRDPRQSIVQPDGWPWIKVRFMVVDVKRPKGAKNPGQPKPFVLKFVDALELCSGREPSHQPPGYPLPTPVGRQAEPSYFPFWKLSDLEKAVNPPRKKRDLF